MLHLPDTFEDLVRLAERADQAFMANRVVQPNTPRSYDNNN